MDKSTQNKIQQLQMLEQNLQNFLSQRQAFQAQLTEVESALEELVKAKKAYRIIGSIMIDSDPAALTKELEEKKETLGIRVKALEKQETEVKNKATDLQKSIMEEIEKHGK